LVLVNNRSNSFSREHKTRTISLSHFIQPQIELSDL
jgi:hypothetical protein